MASVFIDIPGIGNVEAKNAATESTLREILKAMQGVQKNTKDGGGGGDNKGGGGDNKKNIAQQLGLMAGKAVENLGKFGKAVMPAIGYLAGFSDELVKTISTFANVGDSVERAADVFSKVPIVGSMFAAVASAAQKVTDSYLLVTKSGATFGGSISNFASAASSAGMTMDKFGDLIARNGEGMLALGATTEDGARRFAQVSKTLRSTSSDLYALGYSTEDVNQGLASYGKLLRIQGAQGTMTNAQLAAGAKNYLKEMDALAKATGMERSAIEDKMRQVQQDAQFHAYMSNKSDDVRNSFASLITTAETASPELAALMKDYVTTGAFTNAENAKTGAMLGEQGMAALQEMHRMAKAGEKMTAAKQDALMKQLGSAGKSMMDQYGTTLSATGGEFDHAIKTQIGLQKLMGVSLEKAKDGQEKAASGTDKMNEKMQKAQQMLAGFSNSFQMALANSGMLDLMLKAFQFVAGFVQTFLVPAFQILSTIITGISSIVSDYLYPAFLHISDYITQNVQPIFQAMGDFISTSVIPVFKSISEYVNAELVPIFKSMGEFIDKNLSTILDGLGIALAFLAGRYLIQNGLELVRTGLTIAGNIALGLWNLAVGAGAAAMALLTSPVFLVIAGVTALYVIFKKLGGDTKILSDLFSYTTLKFKDMFLALKEGIFSLLNKIPGMRGDFDEDLKEIQEERKQNAEARSQLEQGIVKRAAENRAKLDEQQTKEQAARHQRVDKKILDQKESANAKQQAAIDAKRNLDDTESNLLLDEAKRQKSAYIKDQPSTAASNIASAKAALTPEAAQKSPTTGETSGTQTTTTAPSTTQESPATLLASLNNKMDQLINVNRRVFEVAENQLSVQKGLTGNLYKSI